MNWTWSPSTNWSRIVDRLGVGIHVHLGLGFLYCTDFVYYIKAWALCVFYGVPTIERKSESKKECFFPFVIILLWAKWELGVIGALGLSGFLALLLSCTHLLIVDFLWVVSTSGCRLVKPNHLNLCVVCDCLSLLFHILLIFRISRVLGNMINFLTTSIKAFGSSGSDSKRRRKDRSQEVRQHKFCILKDANWRYPLWEGSSSTYFGRITWRHVW